MEENGTQEEDDAVNLAMDKIKGSVEDYVCYDNLEQCVDDIECPYNEETEG